MIKIDLNNIYKNVRQELANAYDSFLFTEIKKSIAETIAYYQKSGWAEPKYGINETKKQEAHSHLFIFSYQINT